ncbi:SRPBCC family protein [Streptomyces gilvus]|uniref:SRPBCC family protein n=1 Tax=Streptomyces gilvus TaxID=2920937 RepID=UPI001F116A92|nr:SRPBCC family protein [Streptomyces sp. CME 23]MCH5671489.1 SRPBCC family protein [Streptomyces sp. CME 23]
MTSHRAAAERELRAETLIAAPPEAVWRVLEAVRTWPRRSPELAAMLPLKPGGLRPGQWYVGVNRRRAVLWPTRNVITEVTPGRCLSWDTTTSGVRWIFELETTPGGTRLVHRRPVTGRLTLVGRVFARFALGGETSHAAELEHGMSQTLAAIKREAEVPDRKTAPAPTGLRP